MDSIKGLFIALSVLAGGVILGMGIGRFGTALTPEYHPVAKQQPHQPVSVAQAPAAEPDPETGKTLFAANCAACHKPDGSGIPGLAPSIRNRDFLAIASDDFIKATVSAGRPGTAMIPRPDLMGEPMEHIISFLRSLPIANPVQIAVDPHRSRRGDAAAGAQKYAAYCAACHGPNGDGYAGGGVGPGIGLPGFLNVASDDYIFQTAKQGRTGTAMRPLMGAKGLANLQEQDMHDIISHLRSATRTVTPAPQTAAVSTKSDPDQGRLLFAANCAACHQQNGEGLPGLAPSIRNRDFLAIASDSFIRETVHHGRLGTSMVPRPDLQGEKMGHIIAYLRAVEVANPVNITVDPHRIIRGDAEAGAEKYAHYCASCHGANGEGYSAGGSGPGIGLPGFLQVASDDYILQTVKQGRIGTAMMPFIGARGLANLQEEDVADIISHLRSLPGRPIYVQMTQTGEAP